MKLNIYHKAFCEHCTSEIGLNFLGCLECLLLLNNLNHCRVIDFKLLGNSLMAIGYCFRLVNICLLMINELSVFD